jgi:hypothetical protein
MAGDWIKVRVSLATDPAVICMAEKLDTSEFEVVGMLHHLWSWADSQSRDGHASGVTAKWINRFVQRDQFAQAMQDAGWLSINDDGVEFPNFDRHNGESAKARGLAAARKQKQRSNVTPEVQSMSRAERDESVTREEKRREEKKKQDQERAAAPSPQKKTTSTLDHAFLITQGVTAQHAADWLKARKAPLTQTAWDAVVREAEKAGITPAAAIQVCAENTWRGFRADWYANSGAGNGSQNQASQRVDNSAVGQVKRAIAEREAADREAGAVTHGQAGAENVRDIRPPLDGEFRRVV